MKRLLLTASLIAPQILVAQETERILIPVNAPAVPGAYGSVWSTSVTLTNHSDAPLQVYGYGTCHIHPCFPNPIPPDATLSPRSVGPFLEVERSRAHDLTVQLRVQDISRQALTWGTSIPVVRERDLFTTQTLNLTDVVQNERFRSLLRIYDFDPSGDGTPTDREVLVRIYGLVAGTSGGDNAVPDRLLTERRETLRSSPPGAFIGPPTAQLPLWALPELNGFERVRLEITALTPGLRFWAFVSITNNESQHVTTVTPQ